MDRGQAAREGTGASGRRAARRHRDRRAAAKPLSARAVHVGCSGWSYTDWRGRFYPKGMPQSSWLSHYATRFDTVEINNTFYRLPKQSMAEGWAAETPTPFVFTVKVSRYLTHVKRLKATAENLKRFLDPLEPLIAAGKLGPILWQLPPTFKRDDDRLAGALELASGCRNAIEFREPSWFTDDVMSLLRQHRAALVVAERPGLDFQTHELTADWTLIRLHRGRGRGGNYSDSQLDTWRRRIAQWRRKAEVFAYFNNDQNAYAPANAERLARTFS